MKQLKSRARAPAHGFSDAAQVGTLRRAFLHCVELLKQRRADLLQPAAIDAYVELDWLVWYGGSLKLTTVGENIRAQLRNEAQARVPA
jgi:hypothetical protein